MAENLKQPYLTDLTYKSSGCGADYTSLTGWNWQGTQEGCDCTTSSYPSASKIVSAKTCNSTDTSKGCSSMSAVAAMNFTAIQGNNQSINPQTTKRTSNHTYLGTLNIRAHLPHFFPRIQIFIYLPLQEY